MVNRPITHVTILASCVIDLLQTNPNGCLKNCRISNNPLGFSLGLGLGFGLGLRLGSVILLITLKKLIFNRIQLKINQDFGHVVCGL